MTEIAYACRSTGERMSLQFNFDMSFLWSVVLAVMMHLILSWLFNKMYLLLCDIEIERKVKRPAIFDNYKQTTKIKNKKESCCSCIATVTKLAE